MVIWSPADTEALAAGSVPMTWSGGIVESGLSRVRVLKPRFCSAAMASADAWPRTLGTCTLRVLPPNVLMAMVTTIVSTASTATTATQRPTEGVLRSRSVSSSVWRGSGSVRGAAGLDGEDAVRERRSAPVSTLGASGASPLCTRTRSARISAAVW
ncbi:Serine/threonine-protein kinase [Mycobacterium marinum MB2]|nr:Serine/threonine-protein kinase [Mycobacterium marinum MB2]